jgi:hypothetical protein
MVDVCSEVDNVTFPDKQIASWMGTYSCQRQLHCRSFNIILFSFFLKTKFEIINVEFLFILFFIIRDNWGGGHKAEGSPRAPYSLAPAHDYLYATKTMKNSKV